MAIRDAFSNNFETSDNHEIRKLQTHYYQNDYEITKQAVIKTAIDFGCVKEYESEEFKELFFTFKKGDLIITLSNNSYYITGVDIKINTNFVLAFKRPVKIIDEFYASLDKKLTLKRVGGELG